MHQIPLVALGLNGKYATFRDSGPAEVYSCQDDLEQSLRSSAI